MSDAYDPRQEFPASRILIGGGVLVLLGLATVWFIIWGNNLTADAPVAAAPAAEAAAPAAAPSAAPAAAPAATAAPAH